MPQSSKSLTLLLLYGLSGVTALAYEVLWTRMLSLLFGVSILGVVVTVAAFMLGLGLGSFWGSTKNISLKHSWRALILIEFLVAVYAVSLPLIMQFLQSLWISIDSLYAWQFWQISSALLALSLPAMALGFAFPCILRVGNAWGLSLEKLYGVNTLGGALGALLPLLLLPWLGWALALKSVAALGVFISLGLLYLSRKESAQFNIEQTSTSLKEISLKVNILLVYAGMGAGALMLEIAWTRAYGMILLRTEYVLAVILAVFLIGIGFGSILARYINRCWGLKWLPVVMLCTALLGLYLFPYINIWAHDLQADHLISVLFFDAGLIAMCTLPLTLALGAWLPLIAKIETGAALYAANSLGACLGALLAGFMLIPWLGTAATWLSAIGLIVGCACYWQPKYRLGYALLSVMLVLLVGWPVKQLPDAAVLLKQELGAAKDMYQFEDAVSITHVVERDDGQRVLLADLQRMDASSDATAVEVQKNQARLPLFLHGTPKDVLFLGLGTGITASGALPWNHINLQSVELSQGAIHASGAYFDKVNANVMQDMHVYHDDARRFLMKSEKDYDVIVGDLFHPDMVGRGALLSIEEFNRAKARLKTDGVFVQWLAMNQFDIDSLQVVMRSFARVFSNNAVFIDGYRLGLVGFRGEMKDAATLNHQAPMESKWGDEGGWTWLGRYWGNISNMISDAKTGEFQSEWSPVIEYRLPQMRYTDISLSDMLLWLMKHRISFEKAKEVWHVKSNASELFQRGWAATLFNMRAQYLLLKKQPSAARFQQLAYRANPRDRWAGFGLADAMLASLKNYIPDGISYEQALKRILLIRQDHEGALRALIKLKYKQGNMQAAKNYTSRLHRLSPYARSL